MASSCMNRTPRGELLREGAIVLERGCLFFAQLGKVGLCALELDELLFDLLCALRQLFWRHAMLARQLFDGSKAPLDVILSRGIHVQ